MKISLITVGKVKEKFFKDAISEYEKRLSAYCKLQIIEVNDEKTPDNVSEHFEEEIRRIEGERILSKIGERDYVITLEIEGKSPDSVELANYMQGLFNQSQSSIVFVIGGSLGLSKQVKARSNYALSFSALTFPHQLMRVILLEQIYRCFRILNNQPYHK